MISWSTLTFNWLSAQQMFSVISDLSLNSPHKNRPKTFLDSVYMRYDFDSITIHRFHKITFPFGDFPYYIYKETKKNAKAKIKWF